MDVTEHAFPGGLRAENSEATVTAESGGCRRTRKSVLEMYMSEVS